MAEEHQQYRYVGKRIHRIDGIAKVTGGAKFTHDMVVPGMLYARTLKSPYAHARIKRIDVRDAERVPGVRAVVTGRELDYKVGLYMLDKEILAKDYARYQGEPVAAVAADTQLIAEQACEKIKVDWQELDPVLDPKSAIQPDSSLVHPDLGNYDRMHGVFFPKAGTNIAHQQKIRKGDIDEGFRNADLIFEASFYSPPVQHVPLETHASIVQALPGNNRPGGAERLDTEAVGGRPPPGGGHQRARAGHRKGLQRGGL